METEAFKNFWQIYYYIALFATILFVIKMSVFMIFGGDGSEVTTDFNTEYDSDSSFSFLSFQSILAFFMGFGWMGYAALKQFNLPQLTALLSALGVGLLFMASYAWLMFLARKLEKTVKKDKNTALDKIGKAYTKFEPKSQGQIEIEINGQLTVAQAVNNTDEVINAFEQVKVVKVENELLYIEKV